MWREMANMTIASAQKASELSIGTSNLNQIISSFHGEVNKLSQVNKNGAVPTDKEVKQNLANVSDGYKAGQGKLKHHSKRG